MYHRSGISKSSAKAGMTLFNNRQVGIFIDPESDKVWKWSSGHKTSRRYNNIFDLIRSLGSGIHHAQPIATDVDSINLC